MGSLETTPVVQIPLIDIAGYFSGDQETKSQIARELRAACEAPGFFQITGHGVSSELRSKVLSQLSQFFALPLSAKQALHRSQSKCIRGYETVGEQKLEASFSDQKEGFLIGPEFPADGRFLQGPNQWPSEELVPGFHEVIMTYFNEVHALSKTMFRLMALSLNLEETYFDAFVGSEDCESDGKELLASLVTHKNHNSHFNLPFSSISSNYARDGAAFKRNWRAH
ncbi:hypothetical protein DV737_g1179, partial [Chaetothyriales sp. CBS 132003]